MSEALVLTEFTAGYEPGLSIVKGVTTTIARGAFVAILGPNGAGKSTLVKAVAGLVPIHSGSVALNGADITRGRAHERVRDGLAFVPQTENIFATLSIRENLAVAGAVLPKAERPDAIDAVLARFPDLGSRPNEIAGRLSGGQRQMLAAGRALMTNPDVIVLDEPSAGLSPRLVGEVFDRLSEINAGGTTIVLVEQNVRAALRVSGRVIVLVDGRIRTDEAAASLATRDDLGALFLGAAPHEAAA